MKRASLVALAAIALALPTAVACSSPTSTAPAAPPPPANRAALAASASASASGLPPELKAPEYTENDFVESDRNRDPFRSFIVQNQQVSRQALNQRKVELAQYSIDELKLVAIVQGADQPRAMFIDPSGKGTVVYKGTFICRPEVVHIGGSNGPEYQLNWRVDRIRDTDVVLIREDPAQPAIPPATRVIPLHPEQDKEQAEMVPG
ncbi:MAG TPA: pilus assembly protein PilP [Polyangiaceae bacterium]|nr:pilus assembly protein PilP [Polyangiaceae bacterium]